MKKKRNLPALLSRRQILGHFGRIGIALGALPLFSACPGGSRYGWPVESTGLGEGVPTDKLFDATRIAEGSVIEFNMGKAKGYLHHTVDGEWVAVNRKCTHSGCTVAFNAKTQQYDCPCHGSKFDAKGNVLKRPAKRPLRTWQVELSGNEVNVRVGEG